jgi:hypothetical protein
MLKKSLSAAFIAALACSANPAHAVYLNARGMGQVLLYPYYTVNAHQNTLISVANATATGKVVKVRFREGYNGRDVLDFNVYLSPYDVWTAAVFALSDAGVESDGAGILSMDHSCIGGLTNGKLEQDHLPDGTAYVPFRNADYTGSNADGGPTGIDRTREGHFEMIAMGDIAPQGTLSTAIIPRNGQPLNCPQAQQFAAQAGNLLPPTSGLFGAASVVNVGNGTYFAYAADALEGFTSTIFPVSASGTGDGPSLADVNDAGAPDTVTAQVNSNGAAVAAVYPASQAIDAVSAVLDAATVFNQWEAQADGSVGSDWIVTFPTKQFYVDPANNGGYAEASPPFESGFNQYAGLPGKACVSAGFSLFNREASVTDAFRCGFATCPPSSLNTLCFETNVIAFAGPSILGSNLVRTVPTSGYTSGSLGLSFTDIAHGGLGFTNPWPPAHAMSPDDNGTVFYGLPMIGFEAINFVNGNLGGVLANYSGVNRMNTTTCVDTTTTAGDCR